MEWTRGPTIGRGSFAAVSLAPTDTGRLVAVKSADVSSSSLLQNEHCLISQLCSPFIVECFGSDITCENNEYFYNILMEYVAGGTLSDLIRSGGGSLDENVIRFYALQILEGLDYLHTKRIVHCDIKGQNILIGDYGLKIADFGCAKWTERGGSATTAFAGTPAYLAPEVARGEDQSFPADIWALGCTVIEMATGSNPWTKMTDPASALYRVAYSGDVPEIPSWLSNTARNFVEKCLIREPRARWTAAELLQHPFFDYAKKNCGVVKDSNKKSPTSVMDQHFWDALEVPDFSPDPIEDASSSDSPSGRIRDLIGDDGALNFTEWTEEEDWVTVRGNEIEECVRIQHHDEDCVTVSTIDEEETEGSSSIEDSLLDSFTDGVSNINVGRSLVMIDDNGIDDSVSRLVTLKINALDDLFDSSLRLLLQFCCVLSFFLGIILCGHL